jgi:ribonuclease P/MRP protein subunit RPP1
VESPKEIVLPKSQLNVKPARKGAKLQGNSSAVATLKQISRLTLLLDNAQDAHQLLSRSQGITRSYDVIAVSVASEKAFQLACTVLDVDIITLDFASRLTFKMRHDVVKQAIGRGIVFEVPYTDFIRFPAGARRQQFLANVQALALATGGNSMVFSSAAEASFDIRSPYEVINLATFMGLREEQAYDTISKTPARVLIRAYRRRHKGQSAVTVRVIMIVHTNST